LERLNKMSIPFVSWCGPGYGFRSFIYFPHHGRIGQFWRHFSVSHTVSGRILAERYYLTWTFLQNCFAPPNSSGTLTLCSGCSGVVVEYQTRNRDVAGSTHTRSSASNLEQVANLLCAQANSASYPQRDEKWVVAVATVTGWRPNVADWGDGVSASCTVGPIVR